MKTHEPYLFFDALCRIGPRKGKHPAHPWKLEELLREMEHCSIAGALVWDYRSLYYDANFGNHNLSERLSGDQRLHAVWNLLPAGDEMPGGKNLARLLGRHNVRAVSLHPVSNGWRILSPEGEALLRILAELQIPVFIPRPEFQSFAEIEALCERHKDLNAILTGTACSEQREVLPVLRRRSNLHITFEKFQLHYGLEDLVGEGLEDQLIFGSDAPTMSPGAHRSFIDLAAIPERAAQKVASGNLLRLTRIEEPPPRINENEDDLMRAVRHGRALPVPVIDMHMHILDEGLNGGGETHRMSHGGPTGVGQLLSRLGVSGGGFMSWNGTVGCDAVGGNRCTAEAIRHFPESFWGLATMDPTHYSQSQMETQIKEVYSNPRFIGMKPYRHYQVEYHHHAYDPWWEFGNQHALYAGIHRTRPDFEEIESLARRFPNVRWVVFHCGARYSVADQAIECVKRFPNVFAEITLTSVTTGIIDYLVEYCGADRVLYGSDLPLRDPRQQIGWVVFSRLAPKDKIRVLRENALRVISPHLVPSGNTVKQGAGMELRL